MELCILQFSISLTYAWISVKDQLDTHLLSDLVAKVINESLLKRPLQQKNVLDVSSPLPPSPGYRMGADTISIL